MCIHVPSFKHELCRQLTVNGQMDELKYSQGGQYLPNFKEHLLKEKKQLELMHEQMVDLELADC